jgi:sensor histidine kinase YesM
MSSVLFFFGILLFLLAGYLKLWIKYKAFLSDNYSWKKNILTRINLEFIWSLISGALGSILLVLAFSLIKNENLFLAPYFTIGLITSVLWSLFVNLGGEFLYITQYNQIKENRIRIENKEYIKLQKEILQDLISPHFLFNSLNTIISIIPENKDKSIQFVNELSELYNFMLKNSQKESILIKDDLFLAKKYVFLLQTRFESSLNVNFDIKNEHLNCFIPPFTLQNLIENAVKHNAVSKKQNLFIQVYSDEQYLIVKNKLNPKINISESSTNLGLNYIKTLLQQLSESSLLIEQNELDFVVKIPLIYQIKTGV